MRTTQLTTVASSLRHHPVRSAATDHTRKASDRITPRGPTIKTLLDKARDLNKRSMTTMLITITTTTMANTTTKLIRNLIGLRAARRGLLRPQKMPAIGTGQRLAGRTSKMESLLARKIRRRRN